jgi:hypothetical protein
MSIEFVRRAVIAGIATVGAFGAASFVASAAESPAVDPAPLRALCKARGGDFYVTPMAIGRCQEARANKGFAVEQQVCEDVYGGRFASAVGTYRPNRATWVCLVS